jgi:TRAP-type C4-dicarboxylate transport system permease large subunit
LIPPSMGFILIGFLTETSVSALFIAGIIPGIFLTLLFIVQIYAQCIINPLLGPPGDSYSWKARILSLKGCLGACWYFFSSSIIGLYMGIFYSLGRRSYRAFGAFCSGRRQT